MKNIFKTILLSVVVLGMHSCSEETLLDLSPIINIAEEDAFTTADYVLASMNGVYNAAAIGRYNSTDNNGGRGYIWGAAFVEQGDCRGEDVVTTATFYGITYAATYDVGSANNVYYWIDGYRLINRCNLMIEGVNTAVANGVITSAVGNDYIGQAKFLRAITHFELLNYFARCYNYTPTASHLGIPYREVGINTQVEIDSEILKPRNTVAECYTKILSDLNDAESLITNTSVTKASKNAAIAFKTRVYLQKRDWANVITEGNKLTTYSLPASPGTPFILASNFTNTESIFSLSHSSTANPGTNGALGAMYGGRRLVAISPIIWRNTKWLTDDKRRDATPLTGMVQNISGRIYTNKYKDVTNFTDGSPIIRYAEVLLNMAEANARLTTPNLTSALTMLNTVRNRSLATPATQAYTATNLNTPTLIVNAILTERRIEFLMEGRRWSDIQRLEKDDIAPSAGIPAKLKNAEPPLAAEYTLGTEYTGPRLQLAIPADDFRFLWPIPINELNTNPTLAAQQNPGW
ncbi:RagB/SusD family nutrient uptake outer membrane protein [Flavobacterium algicola]|uniref:RagB/SusD family nutrient uptake outer membrane protein n=1 Tax=Flavobacterium algicola TaxID=556529 RepID=UPI001EFD89D8|nr:RagB/SusD family nutrient uptake outer membrane protein [Flavobacterium algicola]MCG9793987.1 RagB/SusD family nutrient uptake outer membrane protein [Flavobacterium algicola]